MATLLGLIKLSFANLRINKLRSALTVVGMVFGTGAVIATLSSNEGAAQYIRKELENMGTNVVTLQVDGSSGGFKGSHIQFLRKYIDNFKMLSPVVDVGGFTLRHGAKLAPGKFIGVDPEFFAETKLLLRSGRLYDSHENEHCDMVVVLGHQVKKELFGQGNAMNEYIHVSGQESSFIFKVIGVLKEKGSASSMPVDSTVFAPPKTLEKLSNASGGGLFLAGTLHDDEKSARVRAQVKALLSKEFPGGVNVADARESIERTQDIWKKQNLVGICLALISLLTGGVGIMNIMLLSVAQRKREIGLRKAVGASDTFVLLQFLLEAVMVCFLGGMAGILLGMFFGQQVAKMMGQWEAVLNSSTIIMALLFAVLTGVLFGLAPAIRASRLDPYEALRG